MASVTSLRACPCCGKVHRVGAVPRGQRAICTRCGSAVARPERARVERQLALGASVAGLVLYPFAISLPIMTLERLGLAREASVWSGALGLLERGELAVGAVVFVCSVVVPLLKLLGLLWLTARTGAPRRHHAGTYRWIERVGRWGMLDVLLVAVCVAWIKLGDLVQVHPGPGALAFTGCVLASLLASTWFDPHAHWRRAV